MNKSREINGLWGDQHLSVAENEKRHIDEVLQEH